MNTLPNEILRLILRLPYPARMPHMMNVCKRWNELYDADSDDILLDEVIKSDSLDIWYIITHGVKFRRLLIKATYGSGRYDIVAAICYHDMHICHHSVAVFAVTGSVKAFKDLYDYVDDKTQLMMFAQLGCNADIIDYLVARGHKRVDIRGAKDGVIDEVVTVPGDEVDVIHISNEKMTELVQEISDCINQYEYKPCKKLPARLCINAPRC